MALTISCFSDVVCPWCFVGKRRLERALDSLGLRSSTTIAWLPFELNPDMPQGGMPRAAYRAAKFGPARAVMLDAAMTERGREDGIAFAFDRIARTPNTRAAHRLILHASRTGRGDAVKERLLKAYFEEGLDIGDGPVLVAVGTAAGLEPAGIEAALHDPALEGEIDAWKREASGLGVSGVPFFVVDGRWAVAGAQPVEHWVAALRDRAEARDAAA